MSAREERFDPEDRRGPRTPFQRDRDRVLYSSAFQRLGSTTQVAQAEDWRLLHNRLTHSLEVAQIARRLAERLLHTYPEMAHGEIDPDVTETAALAHDLGHPPFGHLGEKTLDEMVRGVGDKDGFEGNAQSLRIVTKLAIKWNDRLGLNLSRASLNALLKYPWLRGLRGKKYRKFSVYGTEREIFAWIRDGDTSDRQCVEAQIMDWSDDIAYSVHDLFDFARAGLIPHELLATSDSEYERFAEATIEYWRAREDSPSYTYDDLVAQKERVQLYLIPQRFTGTRQQRALLRQSSSSLIAYFLGQGTSLSESGASLQLTASDDAKLLVEILKQLTMHYVIRHPSLATLQHGQHSVLEFLFRAYLADPKMLPFAAQERLQSGDSTARVVADTLAGMTESQCQLLHRKLQGLEPASVTQGWF